MTLKNIVAQLRKLGHDVTVRQRKDRGIIIKSIDGSKYSGAAGNAVARAMVGETLSPKRQAQLAKITTTGSRAANRFPEDDEVRKALKRTQRKWNKAFPHKRGESPAVGRVTAKKTRWYLEKYGKAETLAMLSERERYAMGKAYSKNIAVLSTAVRDAAAMYESAELEALADDIDAQGWKIDEDTILPAYQELYKLNAGAAPEEVARATRKILKL